MTKLIDPPAHAMFLSIFLDIRRTIAVGGCFGRDCFLFTFVLGLLEFCRFLLRVGFGSWFVWSFYAHHHGYEAKHVRIDLMSSIRLYV